jgi:hypothetical protein
MGGNRRELNLIYGSWEEGEKGALQLVYGKEKHKTSRSEISKKNDKN